MRDKIEALVKHGLTNPRSVVHKLQKTDADDTAIEGLLDFMLDVCHASVGDVEDPWDEIGLSIWKSPEDIPELSLLIYVHWIKLSPPNIGTCFTVRLGIRNGFPVCVQSSRRTLRFPPLQSVLDPTARRLCMHWRTLQINE